MTFVTEYLADNQYFVESVWWIATLAVAGWIVGLLLNRPPRRKEKP